MTKISEGCIAASHPALAGHFPGNPMSLVFCFLGEVLLAVERHFGPLASAWSWPFVKLIQTIQAVQHT